MNAPAGRADKWASIEVEAGLSWIEWSQLLSQLPSLDKQSVNFTGTKLFYLALINKRGRARPAKRLPCLALHRNFTKKWKMTKGHE